MTRAARLLGIALAAGLALTGCSSEPDAPAAAPQRPSATPTSASPTPTPTPTPTGPVEPFTGLPAADGIPDRPAVTVKFDNTAGAVPQVGLDRADLVVEQLVEGGLTRLAAIYHADPPDEVGPVRSLRTSDIGIVLPTGGAVAASGGAGRVIRTISDAGIRMWTEGEDNGFRRASDRRAPYNVMFDADRIVNNSDLPQPASYLDWAAEGTAAPSGEPATTAAVRFSPAQTTEWAFADGAWTRTNGRADPEFAAANLLVLRVTTRDAGYTDPGGNPVPETVFEGAGEATLLLGGVVIEGSWRKDGLGGDLEVLDAAGAPVLVPPGKTWIELVPEAGSVTVS